MAEAELSDPGVLAAQPPRFTPAEIERIAAELFGVDGAARDLGSERDQTFLVDDGARGGVLKVSNAGEEAAVLDFEAAALVHIARADPELPVAGQLAPLGADVARDGVAALRTRTEGAEGTHHVRMFERLHGRSGVLGRQLDDRALHEFGKTLARLARALRGFFDPAAGRTLQWDIKHAGDLRGLLAAIDDDGRRGRVERILDRFDERLAPAWPQLRAQVVHGDLALDNVLLDGDGLVTGIVDFGDLVHTALAADLVAGLASVLRGRDEDDVFRTARLVLDGYATTVPLEREERRLLADLLAARLATIVTISAWRVRRYPENAEYIQAWDAGSWALIELFDAVGYDRVARELGAPLPHAEPAALAMRRRRLLGPALTELTYARPVHLDRGRGAWLYEADGTRLLDGYNNVPVVGHCHPRVTEAVVEQTRLLNTHARYLYEPLVDLAERLVAAMPAGTGLDTVMVVNSGSEANDLAWRIARACTGNAGGLVTGFAYHGVTEAIAALSPEEWPAGHRPSGVETLDPRGAAEEAALAVQRLARRDVAPAALVLDGGFTSDGILTPARETVAAWIGAARGAGALYVADEVQAGHGRTGEGLWSFARWGAAPDLVTLGKPMGNGYPVAAVVARRALVERFAETTDFFSTFGGNPVAARAALAVLDVIDDERIVERAARVGALLHDALAERAARHGGVVAGVRARGLLAGVELRGRGGRSAGEVARLVVDGMRERGVLVGRTGPAGDVLKIRPPLAFEERHVPVLVDALEASLAAV